jgi:F0F1-type ATP synthase assembly protein I
MAKERSFRTLGWYGVIAFELGWIVAAGSLLGYYADGYFGTSPWFTAIGSIGSAAGALYRLITSLGRIPPGGHDDRKD